MESNLLDFDSMTYDLSGKFYLLQEHLCKAQECLKITKIYMDYVHQYRDIFKTWMRPQWLHIEPMNSC